MKSLNKLIEDVKCVALHGDSTAMISALEYDSRKVEPNSCFFAIRGAQSDGHAYIEAAIERGARAVVCEQLPEQLSVDVCYICVECSNTAMGLMASTLYDHPSRSLRLVGITGTNGKTTTATLLYDLIRKLGYKAGLISTVVYCIDQERVESTHTTPDSIRLNSMIRKMVDSGCDYCFMEVSSHSVVQGRIVGLTFAGALFSNITHDHLDYHHTFAEYIKAKRGLFDSLPKGAFALTNIDDRNGEIMVQNARCPISRYSLRSMADFRAKIIEMHFDGMLLRLDGAEVWVGATGRFNAYNMLAIYATAKLLGHPSDEILMAMSSLKSVSGRFEHIVAADSTIGIIDYAHTPDALENVITTIEEIRRDDQQLIVVCGCGGDRDREKRSEMARIATRYAALSIFTSDNPRREDPEKILDDMIEGVESGSRFLRITSRREAIRSAVMFARRGDIILVAGKGHETYQIIGGEKHHFDDHEELITALDEKR